MQCSRVQCSCSEMLSSTELWRCNQEQGSEYKGEYGVQMKHEDSDGSFLQSKQLQFVHKCLLDRISPAKVDKLGSLCIGQYDGNRIIVNTVKGRIWSHFGYNDAGTMVLHPEEALFLMDVGTLRVYYGGVPLSLQEALLYFLKSESLTTLHHYLVYNHLNRMGYIVRRKKESSDGKLLQNAPKRKGKELEPEKSSKALKSMKNCAMSIKEGQIDKIIVQVGSHHSTIQSSTNQKTSPPEKESIVRYTMFDYSNISFPPEGGMKPISPTEFPLQSEKPQTPVESSEESFNSYSRWSGYYSLLDYHSTKLLSTAQSWPQFKEQHKKNLLMAQEQTFQRQKDHAPLVSGCFSSNSLSDVLDRLQLSKTTSLKEMSRTTPESDQPMYDVHQPDPNFKKSVPQLPNHRVVVVKPDSAPPSLYDLVCMQSRSGDVPVHHAVSDNGDISFYRFSAECLPPDLYTAGKSKKGKKSKDHFFLSKT